MTYVSVYGAEKEAIREARIKEIVTEWKCTQKTAHRIMSLEDRCGYLDYWLGNTHLKLHELRERTGDWTGYGQ